MGMCRSCLTILLPGVPSDPIISTSHLY
uniref:Uncharacterized protein n=1 Tax=Anguilla anguilla TaxID=7936 RepID=A0A0E9U9N7_ANGAN